jgi:hypothetical protein
MPETVKQPNLYELSGSGMHITYMTSSFDGQPRLTYQDAGQSRTFTGNQIQSVDTYAGTVVSVVTFLTVDSGSTSLSILIPRVNLISADTVNISTYGITALHRFSIPPMQGQQDFYTPVPLQGTASAVVFIVPPRP